MLYAHCTGTDVSRVSRPARVPVDLVWDAHAVDLIREALHRALSSQDPSWSWTLGLPYAELQHLCAVVFAEGPARPLPGPELHEALLAQVPEIFYQRAGLLLAYRRTNLPLQNARWLAHAICWSCFAGEKWLTHPEVLMQPAFSSVILRYFVSLPM